MIRTSQCLRAIAIFAATMSLAMTAPTHAGEIITGPDGSVAFDGCGVLQEVSAGCYSFITHNGQIYSVENTGTFGDGDTVCVSGSLVYQPCAFSCGPVTGCIFDNTVSGGFMGAGALEVGLQTCLRFAPDAGGPGFYLENLGTFVLGDRVYVEGTIDLQSDLCPPIQSLPGLRGNEIYRYFEGCVNVGPGPQGCLSVSTEDEGFFVLGGLEIDSLFGDRTFISGFVVEDSFACFPVLGDAIQITSQEACRPGDANGDGTVGFADLLEVISTWGPCEFFICNGDLNEDGIVGFSDALLVLSNWDS